MDLIALANKLIPKADNSEVLYKAKGNTRDIMHEVLQAYNDSRHQLKDFAPFLQRASLYDTCSAIWHFVKGNIAYRIDPPGEQWVKTPARVWRDKVCDCKSYSIFIAACLEALNIKGAFRFVSFLESDPTPTHVYIVVKDRGREIILDCVLPSFDQEKPYKHKQDYNMTRISRLGAIGNTSGFTVPVSAVQGEVAYVNEAAMSAAILKERMELEREILKRKNIAGIGNVVNAYDRYIAELDGYLNSVNGVDDAAVGNIFKKIGKGLKKAGKAVVKTVAKVATFPFKLAGKAIIEVTLPKSAPAFIYLFITDPNILAKLPPKVVAKRAKKEKFADFVVNTLGMKRDHFMGILRNGIMKRTGKSPEDYLAEQLRVIGIQGIGAAFMAAAGAVQLIMELINKIASIFGKKPDVSAEEVAPDASDWEGFGYDATTADAIESQPNNVTVLEKIQKAATAAGAAFTAVSPIVQTLQAARNPAPADTYTPTATDTPGEVYYTAETPTGGNTPPLQPAPSGNNNTMLIVAGLGVAALFMMNKK